MENLVPVVEIHHLAAGEDLADTLHEDVPLDGAVEIVDHQEASAQEVLAEFPGEIITQVPVPDFHSVEPGPVELFTILQVDRLFDAAGVYTREAAQGEHQVAVAARVVHRPED